jgi:hypothetical protein
MEITYYILMANSFNNCWSNRTIATLLAKIPEGQNGIFFYTRGGKTATNSL